MKKLLVLGLILGIGILISCSMKIDKNVDKFDLPDSLFALNKIDNTDFIFYNVKEKGNNLYIDLSKKTEFIALDSNYKLRILSPILKQELGVEKDYVDLFMTSYFISKQEKIENYQPLIIWTSGDDYCSLILILIDSTLNPVSHFVLNGGIFAGPYELNDSLTCLGEEKYSKIIGSEIQSYTLNKYVWTDSRNNTTFVDSIIYKSQILENGQIKTEKIDSIRTTKQIEY